MYLCMMNETYTPHHCHTIRVAPIQAIDTGYLPRHPFTHAIATTCTYGIEQKAPCPKRASRCQTGPHPPHSPLLPLPAHDYCRA